MGRLEVLQRLAGDLAQTSSLDVILRAALSAAGATAASLWERTGDRLVLLDQLGPRSKLDYIALHVATPAAVAITTRAPMWIHDRTELAAQFPATAAFASASTEAIASVPLAVSGDTVGVLVLVYDAPREFTEDERAFLGALADHAAAALDRTRLHQRETTTARRLAKLQEATAALASARTPGEVCAVTVQHGSEAVGAASAMLWLREPDGELRARAFHGLPVHYAARFAVLPADGDLPAHRVLATREPLWIETAEDFARAAPGLFDDARDAGRATAFAALPLVCDGEAIGVVAFGYPGERTIGDEDRRFLRALAHACEQSLERAQLYVDAEAGNRAKDAFLGLLGHELRNPLAPIVAALDLMRARGAKFEREIGVIDRQVHHLTSLVDDLLDISRITHGRIELERTVVDLRDAVTAAVARAQPLIDKMNHTVDVAVAPLRVDADRARLVQVLANVITNATQYTPPRGRIAITAEADGMQAIVRVSDSGTGVPPEALATLFTAFGPSRPQGGLGLGLAIAKNLIEQHGGSIAVQSDGVGRGTEVTLVWPLAGAIAEPPPPTEPPRVELPVRAPPAQPAPPAPRQDDTES